MNLRIERDGDKPVGALFTGSLEGDVGLFVGSLDNMAVDSTSLKLFIFAILKKVGLYAPLALSPGSDRLGSKPKISSPAAPVLVAGFWIKSFTE
jgi:hypothetical protein